MIKSEDYRKGFQDGIKYSKPKWINVEEQTPDFNIPVLIKYIKGKQGEVVTQGYYQDEAVTIADREYKYAVEKGKFSENGIETVEFWRSNGYGLAWFDYSGRQIQYLGAKISKNKVIQWMIIPK